MDVFTQENYLDVTELLAEQEQNEKWESIDASSPLMKARRKLISKMNMDADDSCF
jgi:hypothetical protein